MNHTNLQNAEESRQSKKEPKYIGNLHCYEHVLEDINNDIVYVLVDCREKGVKISAQSVCGMW